MDEKQPSSSKNMMGLMNEDLLQNILCRLPAVSFASAACVSKSWNKVCSRILSRPKMAAAISLKSSHQIAVKEVVDKVLSEPIRPHFAIVNVGKGFKLKKILSLLVNTLGSQTPIILSTVSGLMGRDALTDEFREVNFRDVYINDDVDLHHGIVLTVGFLPGLKVDVIPLLQTPKVPRVSMIDQFVMNIRNYTISVSGCASPIGIIMFGDAGIDQKSVIEKLDYAMSRETVIVGDAGCTFLHRSSNDLRNVRESLKHYTDAVALVFASDKDKPQGETQFHFALSKGVSAVGPRYKAVSVRTTDSDYITWLTAKREGEGQVLDGQQILDNTYDELGNHVASPDLYIGVSKRRKCSIGSEKTRWITSLAFHGVRGGDEEYLYVDGLGIKTGDYFQFYHPNPSSAMAACQNLSMHLRNSKLNSYSKNCLYTRVVADRVDKKEVIGGFIFSCCGRGDSFFGRVNVDSSPFLENFPEIPLAGIYCNGEIGRGSASLMGQESQEESSVHCCLHFYSTVYLLMSYTPASSEG